MSYNNPARVFTVDGVKHISLARPNDEEVISLGAAEVSNLACDFIAIGETLHDTSILLNLIHSGAINHNQAKALTRLTQYALDAWSSSSEQNAKRLNQALSQTAFGEH